MAITTNYEIDVDFKSKQSNKDLYLVQGSNDYNITVNFSNGGLYEEQFSNDIYGYLITSDGLDYIQSVREVYYGKANITYKFAKYLEEQLEEQLEQKIAIDKELSKQYFRIVDEGASTRHNYKVYTICDVVGILEGATTSNNFRVTSYFYIDEDEASKIASGQIKYFTYSISKDIDEGTIWTQPYTNDISQTIKNTFSNYVKDLDNISQEIRDKFSYFNFTTNNIFLSSIDGRNIVDCISTPSSGNLLASLPFIDDSGKLIVIPFVATYTNVQDKNTKINELENGTLSSWSINTSLIEEKTNIKYGNLYYSSATLLNEIIGLLKINLNKTNCPNLTSTKGNCQLLFYVDGTPTVPFDFYVIANPTANIYKTR